jgi:hypothetical protein
VSLPWVKLHVPLLDNEDYKRFSPAAQHLYTTLLLLAGKQDRGDFSGRLEAATGPLTTGEIRSHAKYEVATLNAALKELLKAKFVTRDDGGTLIVARFKDKAAPRSNLSTDRVRAHREREGNYTGPVSETNETRSRNVAEVEAEYASLRSAAFAFHDWPDEPDRLRDLAVVFLNAFGNTRDPRAVVRNVRPYTATLLAFQKRGATIERAWMACEACWIAGKNPEKPDKPAPPLFGAMIKSALDFLPSLTAPRRTARANNRGTDYDAIHEAAS